MVRYDEWYKIGWIWNNGRVGKRIGEIGVEKKLEMFCMILDFILRWVFLGSVGRGSFVYGRYSLKFR